MTRAYLNGIWREFRGSLRVLRGRLSGNRREIVAGKLDQVLGRVTIARERADAHLKRELSAWRARNADFFKHRARSSS